MRALVIYRNNLLDWPPECSAHARGIIPYFSLIIQARPQGGEAGVFICYYKCIAVLSCRAQCSAHRSNFYATLRQMDRHFWQWDRCRSRMGHSRRLIFWKDKISSILDWFAFWRCWRACRSQSKFRCDVEGTCSQDLGECAPSLDDLWNVIGGAHRSRNPYQIGNLAGFIRLEN